MKITLLGGGHEIGASCIHIQLGGTNLLIDAGMRMHEDDPMPSLGMLPDLGGVDAILVTHAHADHIGALPLVKAMYPHAPVYTSAPTMDLIRIMMRDSYRILEARYRMENRLVPYTEQQMVQFLDQMLAFPASGTLRIGDVDITAYRAGHILGATMFSFTDGAHRLLVTGDLSFKAGRTIHGAKVPYGLRPDVVVMESTYGNRMHTDRNAEEKRLAENVAEVVSAGGFVLIPAFALGRSQEVLLILQDYMEKGLIPSFPIYVDGMVTPICRIYREYPQYLKGPVAHRIRTVGDAFIDDKRCIAVKDIAHREQILQGKPGCIVASSGMLIGGASLWYAEKLVEGEKNAIFITGYQDEESPGRKLLALAEGKEHSIEINGTTHLVRCKVDQFGLSAHADAMEMTRFIEELAPVQTLLVHGDDEARHALANTLPDRYGPILTENSITYSFEPRSSGQGIKGRRYSLRQDDQSLELDRWVGQIILLRDDRELLYPAICLGIHARTRTLNCQTFRRNETIKVSLSDVVETLGAWSGQHSEAAAQLQEVMHYSKPTIERLRWTDLEPGINYSLADACLKIGAEELGEKLAAALALLALPEPFSYRVQDKQGYNEVFYCLGHEQIQALSSISFPIQAIRVDAANAMNSVRELLEGHARYIRCGAEGVDTSDPTLMIYFDFPEAVQQDERDRIAQQIKQRTGWEVQFSPSVRQDLLEKLARQLLGNAISGSPSIHLATKSVVVDCQSVPDWDEIQEQYRQTTGFSLLQKGSRSERPPMIQSKEMPDYGEPMEINLAQQEVRKWASEQDITIYKASVRNKGGVTEMELHYISPQVAARYTEAMQSLAKRVRMPITYNPNPKQNEIIAIASELVPASWGMTGNPSIHSDQGVVMVKLSSDADIDDKEFNQLSDQLYEKTGYRLRQK